MPNFHFKSKDKDGDTHEGIIVAKDRFDVYRQARKQGRTIISVTEQGGAAGVRRFFSFSHLSSLIGSVKTSEKIIFTRNMTAMINAGLTLSRSLSIMERQTRNPFFKNVLVEIGSDIKRGSTFHESLAKHEKVFSPLFVSMVKAGEEGGTLSDSLKVVGQQIEQSYQLKKKIRGALIYPSIVVVAMIIIGILMMIYVVPTLSQTFDELGAELPISTQIILGTSDFLANNTFIAIGALLMIVGGMVAWFKTPRGRRVFEFIILHIPIIKGIVKETNSARTARTFASLLVSGVEIVTALGITKDVIQNSYYKDVIKDAEKEIQKGNPISKVFISNDQLYPVLFGEIIAVGEETGKLSEMLEEVAVFYEEEVSQKTKDMSTIIEPFLMLIVGGAVGFFAVSMISPIYSISDAI